ncbi:MAG: D-2-hydroxyacid dehydrogenase [Lachnospiraceae bacterium]|nr:D-2-hydroxyacid dehydrogenase [Lachnospiraceae bacterium]
MRIVSLDGTTIGYKKDAWDELKQFGEYEMTEFGDSASAEEIIDYIGDAEIVLTNKVVVDRKVMDACPKIRMIQVLATGYNVVDTAYAKEKGIVVSNIPAYSTMSVCQHTIGLLLEICNQIGHHDRMVHQGKWTESRSFSFWDYELMELDGKTIGIIGFGTIGQAVAKAVAGFGMKVIAYTPHPKTGFEGLVDFVDLNTLFAESDVITLHCMLNDETREIICRENIDKMKDGVILINASRGQVLNESDVAEALKNGKISAAGVDVVSSEPIRDDNPLLSAPNCIITPHIAWATAEARKRLLCVAIDNVRQFIAGTPVNIVN